MRVMNWEQMKDSPATRGFVAVVQGSADLGGFLLKTTFKPAFMSHAENPSDNKLGTLVKLQVFRSFIPIYMSLLTGVTKSGWNGQLNSQNVAFALGVAFFGAGLVDMAGLGLQAIGENRK